MCDFRNPPTGMVEDGENIPVTFRGYVDYSYQHSKDWYDDNNVPQPPYMSAHPWMGGDTKFEEGAYYVCATGSSYQYYDGEHWEPRELLFEEGDDWSCGHPFATRTGVVPVGGWSGDAPPYSRINISAELGRKDPEELNLPMTTGIALDLDNPDLFPVQAPHFDYFELVQGT